MSKFPSVFFLCYQIQVDLYVYITIYINIYIYIYSCLALPCTSFSQSVSFISGSLSVTCTALLFFCKEQRSMREIKSAFICFVQIYIWCQSQVMTSTYHVLYVPCFYWKRPSRLRFQTLFNRKQMLPTESNGTQSGKKRTGEISLCHKYTCCVLSRKKTPDLPTVATYDRQNMKFAVPQQTMPGWNIHG